MTYTGSLRKDRIIWVMRNELVQRIFASMAMDLLHERPYKLLTSTGLPHSLEDN